MRSPTAIPPAHTVRWKAKAESFPPLQEQKNAASEAERALLGSPASDCRPTPSRDGSRRSPRRLLKFTKDRLSDTSARSIGHGKHLVSLIIQIQHLDVEEFVVPAVTDGGEIQ